MNCIIIWMYIEYKSFVPYWIVCILNCCCTLFIFFVCINFNKRITLANCIFIFKTTSFDNNYFECPSRHAVFNEAKKETTRLEIYMSIYYSFFSSDQKPDQ